MGSPLPRQALPRWRARWIGASGRSPRTDPTFHPAGAPHKLVRSKDRRPYSRCGLAFALLPETPREVVEQGRKNQGDVPAPNETLDQAEKECRPAQEFEAWQEDAKRLVLYWERPSLTESESRD